MHDDDDVAAAADDDDECMAGGVSHSRKEWRKRRHPLF